jgi:acyl dehydratase
MSELRPEPLTIDASGVGLHTIARTCQLDARRALAFASGVLERSEPYCDDMREGGLIVHPGIAFSLQFQSQKRITPPPPPALRSPDAWIGAVHAETNLVMHAPFEVGQVITTQGRLIGRKQTRAGVYNVERYRMVDASGQLLAEMDYNLMFRGAVLTGGDVEIEPMPERPRAPELGQPKIIAQIPIPREALHHYTACSDIYAPIHTERRVARAAGFSDIILHGSATKSIALSAVVKAFFGGDARRVRRLYGQLRAVVPADTSISVEALATRHDTDGQLSVFFRVLNHEGQEAVSNGLVSGIESGASPAPAVD